VVLNGEEVAVGAGSAVFVPGNLEHGIRNTGNRLSGFFCAFLINSLADIEYRFSTPL
jgi:hypothetical protein